MHGTDCSKEEVASSGLLNKKGKQPIGSFPCVLNFREWQTLLFFADFEADVLDVFQSGSLEQITDSL